MKLKMFEAGQYDDPFYAQSPVAQTSSYDLDEDGLDDPREQGSAPTDSKAVVKAYLQATGPGKQKDLNDPNIVRDFLIKQGFSEEKVNSILQAKTAKPSAPATPATQAPQAQQQTPAPEDKVDLGSGLDDYTKGRSTELTPEQQDDFAKVQRFVKSGVLNKRQLSMLIKELENND